MTPPRTHGLVQAVNDNALTDAADLRREADEYRAKAVAADRLASLLESMHALAATQARDTKPEGSAV